MKKSILLFFFLITIFNSYSQSVSGGLRGGMNIANQSYTTSGVSVSFDSKIGFLLGGYLTIMPSEKFGVQPELVYSQMGYKSNLIYIPSGSVETTVSLNYLALPILARYNITDNFSLQVGPQLGYLLSASTEAQGKSTDVIDQFNKIDLGGAFGIGLDFGKFNAGGRYYLGFANLNKNSVSVQKATNNAFQLFVGYKLFGK